MEIPYLILTIIIIVFLGGIIFINNPQCSNSNSSERLLNLIYTDKYKNSKYKIQKINDYYVLNIGDEYVDLTLIAYKWRFNHRFYKDCKGSLNQVIDAFNELNPDVETIEFIESKTTF